MEASLGQFVERLETLEAQMRTNTAALNALTLLQKPGPIARFLQQPTAWLFALGFLGSVVGFTWRSIGQMQSNTARIHAIEELVPISRRNQERIAKGVDNICYGMQDVREALRLRPRDCERTEIEPMALPTHDP